MLLVVSHVIHYRHDRRLFAYGPYAREIEVWADLFPLVLIASPCRNEPPPGDCLPLSRPNIAIAPQRETGGETWRAKAAQVLMLPVLTWGLGRAMLRADAIHVRCPGNLGLLGAVLGPVFCRRLVAKYAGSWKDFPGEDRMVRLQKAILRSRWWRGPVTVYGEWPGQPPHVVPFFTSVLTGDQLRRAQAAVAARRSEHPLRILFVGRLSAAKHVDTLVDAIGQLARRGLDVRCTVVGEGPQRAALEAQIAALGVQGRVEMAGAVEFDQVLDFYERSDVLVLASESEGWPKAIAEAMAFGLVCIGSDRGLVPQMLGEGRGLVVPPGDATALADALDRIARSPGEFSAMRSAAAAWAQRYSLDDLREAIRTLLESRWHVSLDGHPSQVLTR